MNKSTVIYAIIITASVLLGSWLLFWGANALVWIMSLDFSPFALLTEMMSGGGLLTKFISYMLSFEWAYGLAFLYILITIGKEEGRLSDTERLIFAIPTILIIMIYDPRIASYMPGFIESALRFLQQTCAARLIGGVSWLNHSTDTAIYDGFYFTVFDMMIAGVYLFWYWSSSKND